MKVIQPGLIWRVGLGILIVLAGTGLTLNVMDSADRRLREQRMEQVRLVAQALNIDRIRAFSGGPADLESAGYQRLKDQLTAVRQSSPGCRRLCLLGRNEQGEVFVYVDGNPPEFGHETSSGGRFQTQDRDLGRVFDTPDVYVGDPKEDRWGRWICAYAPIVDPKTGACFAVLGMETSALAWCRCRFFAALPSLVLTLTMLILFASGAFVLARRAGSTGPRTPWLRYGEVLIAVTAGLAATVYVAVSAHHREDRARYRLFMRLASGQTAAIAEQFRDIGRIELEGLAAMVDSLRDVSGETFGRYAAHLIENPAVKAWQWIPAVSGSEKDRFEQAVRDSGSVDFAIWEADDRGGVRPVGERDRYYPVRFTEPHAGNEAALGFDLGSAPLWRDALEQAARTGLTTAGRPLPVHDDSAPALVLPVFRPLYHASQTEGAGAALRGFAMAVLDLTALIGPVGHDRTTRMSLHMLQSDGPPLSLAGTGERCTVMDGRRSLIQPVLAFGRVFAVKADAGDDFLRHQPVQDVWRVGLVGLLLTFFLGLVVWLLTRRREKLECLVAERTGLLREQEREHRLLTEHAIVAIATHEIVLDDDGRPVDYVFLSANPAFETHTGLRVGDVIGRRAQEVLPGIENTPFIDTIGKVVLTGEPVSFDQYSDVLDRHFFFHAYRLGEHRFATVFSDVTERKKNEGELRESEQRLKTVLNSIDAFVYVMDFDTYEILFVNDYGRRFWGDILGQLCHEALQNLNEPCSFCRNGELRDAEENPTGVCRWEYMNDVNGRFYDVREYAVEWVDGRLVKMHIATDITERKNMERDLEASREQYELAVRGSKDGIWDWNLRDGTLFLSAQWKRQLGYEDSELPNRFETFETHLHPDDKDRVLAQIQAYLAGAELLYELEFRLRHKDGSYRWFLARGEAMRGPDGLPVRMAGSHADITQRKQTEEELIETNRQLEMAITRANEMAVTAEMASLSKSDFLANMSHEIRTPMNGVIGMAGLLLDTPLSAEQRRYAQTIATSGESLLALINDILDFSKIEAGKLSLDRVDFDLSVLLEDVAASLAVRFHEKGIELISSADPDVPLRLSGDPGRLRQILTNLAGNALKFTHEGEVEIRASVDGHGERGDGGQTLLRFSVRDTGIGIPEDKLVLLFDKFIQADSSISREYGGTGLGLAISRQLAELMGGEIGVDSQPGLGSTFWFTARFERWPGRKIEEFPDLEELSGVRVLIVDDNQASRRILAARMMSWGMRPREVIDGATALQTLYAALDDDDPYRLAVIDKTMPSMDGEVLGRIITAEPRFSDLRMVMLTSMGVRGDARRLADLGFAGYLTKPVRPRELQGVLSLSLSGKALDLEPPLVTRHLVLERPHRFNAGASRILLVEDNVTNQQVVQGMLERLGLSADVAPDGRAAMEALDRPAYDLVLMDCQMPVMDGLEATRQIRRRGYSDLPIIALTAHAMQGDRETCLAAGMNDYLTKPLSTQALVAVLKTWLPDSAVPDGVLASPGAEAPAWQVPAVWNRQAMLDRLDGDERLAETIVGSFLSDVPNQLQHLETLLRAGDHAGAERQAHTLAGAASIVGGQEVETLSRAMETALRNNRLNDPEKALTDVRQACDRLAFAIKHPEGA